MQYFILFTERVDYTWILGFKLILQNICNNVIIWTNLLLKQEENADPTFKPDFCMFLLIFQHKWMFLSIMQTLPFEGHNVAYQCKGLDQSNIVCEYEVNPLTNDKDITEIQNFNAKW